VARDLAERTNQQDGIMLKDHTVVFPNKRACLFFNQYLTDYITPPFWAPHYTTISEIYLALSQLTVADKSLLVYYLYKAYVEVTKSEETFDQFYSWGEILLNDFEDIDNNMVDAQSLFINITDIEKLTNFDFIDEEQEQVIRRLFNNFSTDAITELHKRYLHMWNAMPDIYHTFRSSLQKKELAYDGMMKRTIAEQLKEGKDDGTLREIILSRYSHVSIVGFNVLNQTDKILFLFLRENCDVRFYWDYDDVYNKANSPFEAGMFINENIRRFGNSLSNCPEIYQGFREKKDIQFVAASTDNAQCQYVNEWLQKTLKADEPLNKTAIVLCDEHLLMPTLRTIPSTYGTDQQPTLLNITMGYPMQSTPVASFVTSLLDLYFRGWMGVSKKTSEGKWRYIYAEKVLQHPYMMMMNKQGALDLMTQFRHKNTTYPSVSDFKGEFIEDVFAAPPTDHLGILKHTANIVQRVAIQLSKSEMTLQQLSAELYSEAMYAAWTMINNYCDLMENHGLEFTSFDTLIHLIRQAISSKSIAFHGEPAIGIQLMGILETRNLDFDNVIILSVNEGMLPKNTSHTSFILHFLRKANDMTTAERQLGLYAYYFYRLLQRAKHITLVYNESTDGLHRGEMSRFMMQLKYEKERILSADSTLQEFAITNPTAAEDKAKGEGPKAKEVEPLNANRSTQTELSVDKSCNKVRKALEEIKSFSPSALNTYLDCPLRFYLQYVCGYREEEEINEDVADNVFGSIFHNAMEWFYKDKIGVELDRSFFLHYINDTDGTLTITKQGHQHIRRCVDKGFACKMFNINEQLVANDQFTLDLNGTQLLNHEVIARYMEKQLKNDYQLAPLTILSIEEKYYHDIHFESNGRQCSQTIGGIIDREDIVTLNGARHYRIVDYKTSVSEKTAKTIDDLFIPSKKRSGYIFQTFCYSEVRMAIALDKGESLPAIMPTLLYIKRQMNPEKPGIHLDKEQITDYQQQCHEEFHQRLSSLLAEIYDVDTPFTQTSDTDKCEYCAFKLLCNRI
jgi:CRISPR/Cas system-associated exonuclease Cas4 (RecB family)